MQNQEGTAGTKHTLVVNYQTNIAHCEQRIHFQLLLRHSVKTQLMWPLVVDRYTLFHRNRTVVRPVANQSCGKNRDNRQQPNQPHSFFGKNDILAKLLPSVESLVPFSLKT